eukprot:5121691-Lingulodinium_polyedra.AAC.1
MAGLRLSSQHATADPSPRSPRALPAPTLGKTAPRARLPASTNPAAPPPTPIKPADADVDGR